MAGARAQRELDHLVAEVLGVGDAGGLLDLGELLVQQLAVHQLAGIGILEVLVLDPRIGIVDIAVEEVLAVVVIALQIGLLDLVADELRIARREVRLDELHVALLGGVGQLLAPHRLLQHVHEMDGVGARSRSCRG